MDKKIDQLTRAYSDFIDIASHDLDAPLRKLSVLVDRLTSQKSEEEQQPYLNRIQTCIADMRAIIDGLSMLSRIVTEPLKLKDCDLSLLINTVEKELETEFPGKKIYIHAGVLSDVEGDEEKLKILFKGLFENSVVFNQNETIDIRVSFEETKENQVRIVITDNGIGFNQENAERIFRPFERLHGKSEYPGKGLGLAIGRRIAEIHKGTLEAEGNVKGGASFILVLPRKQS